MYTNYRPSGPKEVIVTGSFDNWSKTLPLVKQADGSFELTVPFQAKEKVLYKYVVDDEWLVNQLEKLGKDDAGIENNVLETSDLVEVELTSSKIPEAAGLTTATAGLAAVAGKLKTTVMPTSEGQQKTLGEPGIFVPKDAEALAAFETVRNVDPKTLNEPETVEPVLTAEEKKKQKKKLKRTQYKAKKKAKAAETGAAAGAVVPSSSNPEESTEIDETPEPETLDPAVVGAVGTGAAAKEVEAEVPATSVADETLVDEPVVAEEAVAEAPVETKAVEEVVAPVEAEVTAPVEAEVAAPAEVDASPIKVTKAQYDSDDDIIVAQGGQSAKEIEQQLDGDVSVEEIQPTPSEAKQLTEEANIELAQEPKKAATKPAATTKPAAAKKEKKKGSFWAKVKKIFK